MTQKLTCKALLNHHKSADRLDQSDLMELPAPGSVTKGSPLSTLATRRSEYSRMSFNDCHLLSNKDIQVPEATSFSAVSMGVSEAVSDKKHKASTYPLKRAKVMVLLGDLSEEHELQSRKFTLDIDLTTFPKMIIAVATKMYGDSEGDEFKLCFMTEGEERHMPAWESLLSAVVRAKEHGALPDGHGMFVLRLRSIMRAVQGKDTKKTGEAH